MTSLDEFTEQERIDDKECIIGALKMTLYSQKHQRDEINKEIRKTKRLIKKMEEY